MKITRKKKRKKKRYQDRYKKENKAIHINYAMLYIQVHTRSVVTLSIEYKECRFDIRKNKRESFIVRLQAPRG